MPFKDKYDFDVLKNETERLVIDELERQAADRPGLCLCEECVLDMAALALNAIKPLYRVSLLGTLYTSRAMDEMAYAQGVRQAVSTAIDRVGANPSHE
jgi:competence protein ComFB